jgi:hypothetical protein
VTRSFWPVGVSKARWHVSAAKVPARSVRWVIRARSVADALRDASFDEIIVARLPPGTSQWLVEGLPNRPARRTALPVTHLVAEAQLARSQP